MVFSHLPASRSLHIEQAIYKMKSPSIRCFLVGLILFNLVSSLQADRPAKTASAALEPLVVDTQGEIGGRLVAALRAEPRTFNPLLATDRPSLTIARRLGAGLIAIDGSSHRTTPALATSWKVFDGGRRLRLTLRRGVRFSDGHPLDADDVLFTFQVYTDPEVASPNRDLLIVAGEPVRVVKIDHHTLDFFFAAPYAVGERLFDGISILPQHRLQEAYENGTLLQQWGLGSSAEDIVGLGPYKLVEYIPGERLELERNPYYWKNDSQGKTLPYLDRLTFVFVTSQEAQALRFESGDIHLVSSLSSESFTLLERSRRRQEMELRDVGPGLAYNFLFFNLNSLEGKNLPQVTSKQNWFRRQSFRQAISAAIDRQSIIRLVYRGKATAIGSHVTSGNKLWINRQLPIPQRSLEKARQLFANAGFSWRADGRLIDEEQEAVGFTLVTSSSNQPRLDMATIIERDLAEIGIEVQIVPLEFRGLIDRLTQTFDYEASLLALGGGDADPNGAINVWKSSGGNHLWHLGQEKPATPWEAKIDQLLNEQLITTDPAKRKALYDRLQHIVADQLPFIFLVSPNVLVGAHQEVGNFAPSILGHANLWNVDTLYLRTRSPQ